MIYSVKRLVILLEDVYIKVTSLFIQKKRYKTKSHRCINIEITNQHLADFLLIDNRIMDVYYNMN